MDPEQAVVEAERLVGLGQFGAAKRVLLAIPPPGEAAGRFRYLRALARCHRAAREFDAARALGEKALEIARDFGHPRMVAVALEALGLTEQADGRIRAAGARLWESAGVERAHGDLDASAAALNNYGHMLIVHDVEGAEDILGRALADATEGSSAWAAAADNMANELERQGRHAEAADWGRRAVDAFAALGAERDRYTAMRNLARHLAATGREAEAGATYEGAHGFIHELRRRELDHDHYARYGERTAAIEARSHEVLERAGEKAPALAIGLHAMLGEEALQRGIVLFADGRFGEALQALDAARKHWEALEACHMIVRVDHHRAITYVELGERSTALDLTVQVRALAHDLGDARTELMALTTLVRLGDVLPAEDDLDTLAQAHALEPIAEAQAERFGAPAVPGALAAQAAQICGSGSAYGLAERYLREAIDAAGTLSPPERYRLAYRLFNLQLLLQRADRAEAVPPVLDDLRAVVESLGNDPRGRSTLARATARVAFHEGDRSEETLTSLVEECSAYELLREQARGAGLAGFSEEHDPPYDEAAEVALALGRPALSLALVEHAKARTLAEDLGLARGDLPPLDGEGTPPDLGLAVGLELFATGARVVIFVVDGDTVETVTVGDQQGLEAALAGLSDAADDERATQPIDEALDAVLGEAGFARLAEALLAMAPAGRTIWLGPHRFLHQAPLQLAGVLTGSNEPLPWSIVPALPLARVLPPARQRPAAVVACGDPLGDLPFARAEARLVAGSEDDLAIGERGDVAWLQARVADDDFAVLHLACHGRFDRGHPERSGLLLAAPDDEAFAGTTPARLLTVDEVAELPLRGVVVVLSACSSGLEVIRDGDEASGLLSAFLRAGASAVLAAQWPIPDLGAMVMMLDFHERLHDNDRSLRALLHDASERLRTMTASELADTGTQLGRRLIGAGASGGEAVMVASGCVRLALGSMGDEAAARIAVEVAQPWLNGGGDDAEATLAALDALRPAAGGGRAGVMPFQHPRHWGAFAVVGRDG